MHSEANELEETFAELFRNYYKDEIATLAQRYPSEQRSLYIEAEDLYRTDPDLLADYKTNPSKLRTIAEDALELVDLPIDVSLAAANVRVTDTSGYLERVQVDTVLGSDYIGQYVALRAQIGDVTGKMSRMKTTAFRCHRCGEITTVEQPFTMFQEPDECDFCTRDGPFDVDFRESDMVDQQKVRFEQPPEQQAKGGGDEIVGYCLDDLVTVGGENGLPDKAGSRVTVLGTVEVDGTDLFGRGTSEPVIDKYFRPHAFIFDEETESIDIDEYRAEVEECASQDNAIDSFRTSIDPGLEIVGKWDAATEMATAWLFGAPRINPDGGDMVRGDLHMLFVSDPGMRKSVFAENLAEISPQCLLRDAGGMSSEVGLTSSASQDAFGDGKWTLTPGALPRANGGHLILDEVDKGPSDFLGGIHGALEGDQQLKVNKADIQATLATRAGFMALGNPVEGRFDKYSDIAEQIDLDPALMSRFDLIVTMSDDVDKETDSDIARGIINSIDESAKLEFGDLDESESSELAPEVPRNVLKAWVKLARDEINPILTDAAKGILKRFYVDARQLNEGKTDKPPVTARKLVAGWRISAAFARCELSETIEEHHAKRAIQLSKAIISENFDPETATFDADRTTETPSSQQQRVDAIQNVLQHADNELTVAEVAERANVEKSKAEHRLNKMKNKNPTPIQETEPGTFRWLG